MTGHILTDVTLQLYRQVSQEHNHRGAVDDYLNMPGVTLRTQLVSFVKMEHTRQSLLHREVWGSHIGADSNTSFLRRFVMPAGTSLLTFRRSVLPSSSG